MPSPPRGTREENGDAFPPPKVSQDLSLLLPPPFRLFSSRETGCTSYIKGRSRQLGSIPSFLLGLFYPDRPVPESIPGLPVRPPMSTYVPSALLTCLLGVCACRPPAPAVAEELVFTLICVFFSVSFLGGGWLVVAIIEYICF